MQGGLWWWWGGGVGGCHQAGLLDHSTDDMIVCDAASVVCCEAAGWLGGDFDRLHT
jgi:hypothetical protein